MTNDDSSKIFTIPRKGTLRVRAAQHHATPLMRLKFIVVGDVAAGKSCLIARYQAMLAEQGREVLAGMNNAAGSSAAAGKRMSHGINSTRLLHSDLFAPPSVLLPRHPSFNPRQSPTVGVEFHPAASSSFKQIDGQRVRVQTNFFDMSGAPEYARIRSEFFSDLHGVLLCFDLCSTTMDGGSSGSWSASIEKWLDELGGGTGGSAADGPPRDVSAMHVLIVGCKLDQAASSGTRVISEHDARAWCKLRGLSYFECSASTGEGVAKVFEYLIQHAKAEVKQPAIAPHMHHTSQSHAQGQDHGSFARPPSGSPNNSPPSSASMGGRPTSSTSSSTSSNTDSSSSGPVNISSLSSSELRRECLKRGISVTGLTERSEFLQALRSYLQKARSTSSEPSRHHLSQQQEKQKQSIIEDVQRWASGKDIRAMLNDIHGWTVDGPSLPDGTPNPYLQIHTSFAPVSNAYRKALVKIHPDKVAAGDTMAHVRATEMFKVVSAAFENFKQVNEKRLTHPNGPSAEFGSASSSAHSSTPRARSAYRR